MRPELFGAGCGAWLLRERFGARRWMAVAMIVGGMAGMRNA
jgi:drug/metabolite transporter (DMT)-like permease